MTDAKSLVYLFRYADPLSRLFRWQMTLMEFNIENIEYLKGEENSMADYLSRTANWSDPVHDTPLVNTVNRINPRLAVRIKPGSQSELFQSMPTDFCIEENSSLVEMGEGVVVIWPIDTAHRVPQHPNVPGLERVCAELRRIYVRERPCSGTQFRKCQIDCKKCQE